MIEHLSFDNFKRFKHESLDLSKPITLLYGENSSGKSSALKGLAAMLQTFSWTRNKHEPLLAQGEYANLGVYKDYVHNHNPSNKITMSITTGASRWYESREWTFGSISKQITKICYDRSPYTEQARIYSIEAIAELEEGVHLELFKLKRAETKSYYTMVVNEDFFKSECTLYRMKARFADKEYRRVSRLKTKLTYTEGFNFILAANDQEDLAAYKIRVLDRYMYSLMEIPERYKYLGPLRSSPSRSYTISAASSDVGAKGENTPSVISYLKRSSESIRKNKEAYKKMQNWINLIFPGRSITVEDYEELVKLKVARDGMYDSIQDVGFGFSQILPIIVQAAAIQKKETIIIEQPELHLHPRAQVAFSQFLIEACREGKRFVIETHSEHILRGLQLAVSENSIDSALGITKNDLMVYYFPSNKDERAFEIEINDDGELVNGWPAGFFDESYNLTKKIIKNKISKMTGTSNESSN